MAPTATKKKSIARTALPLPSHWRALFVQASVCFDVTFSKSALDELAADCGTSATDFYFTGSSRTDPEAGLTAHTKGKPDARRLHVSFEFQRQKKSPYPKLPQKTIAGIVRRVAAGAEIVLRHAEFAYSPPDGHSLSFPETEISEGRKTRLTGFQFETVSNSPADPEKGTRVRLDRESGVITITNWLRISSTVKDLEAGFALAMKEALNQTAGS
jgi:hypothetical protein